MADGDLEALASSVHEYRARLEQLDAQGRHLRALLNEAGTDGAHELGMLREWQRRCASTISELSGGRKVHWLSRAFSEALLVPLAGAESAGIVTIIDRILVVLDRAGESLEQATPSHGLAHESEPALRARFSFIENGTLRSHLERAYLDGQTAFSHGEFTVAVVTFSSILETVITVALERHGLDKLATEALTGRPVDWPFATRLAMAERKRLISGGCARLPEVARQYRDLLDGQGEIPADVSVRSHDAKLTRDVLHIILRDLAPGR